MSDFAVPSIVEEASSSVFDRPMYRVSHLLARNKGDGDATLNQVLRAMRASGILRWMSIRVSRDDISSHYDFALATQGDSEVLARGAAAIDGVVVTVDVVVPAIHEEGAPMFANFLAQQLALFARRHDLRDQNAALREEARLAEETIALRKFMERAKSLIVSQRGFTPDEAEDWLVGASVRYGKPLLNIAREIVAVLSNPVLGIDAAA